MQMQKIVELDEKKGRTLEEMEALAKDKNYWKTWKKKRAASKQK